MKEFPYQMKVTKHVLIKHKRAHALIKRLKKKRKLKQAYVKLNYYYYFVFQNLCQMDVTHFLSFGPLNLP